MTSPKTTDKRSTRDGRLGPRGLRRPGAAAAFRWAPGLKMSQTPQGTVYSLAERSERRTEATPMPFDIRTVASGETISLEAWMPADTTTVVRRNGYLCRTAIYAIRRHGRLDHFLDRG